MSAETDDERLRRIAAALDTEIERRNEWYGLDNWLSTEVVAFVLERLDDEGEPSR